MAKKRRTYSDRNRASYVPWPWLFWPLAPLSEEQLDAGAELARARGKFWQESFEAMAGMVEDWKKAIPSRRR